LRDYSVTSELIEIDWLRAFGRQKSVDESLVAKLVAGIIVNVLRHVRVEVRQRRRGG
jgi:hypothetical protein